MKKAALVSLIVCLALVAGGTALARKKQIVKSMGGTVIPRFGIIIDAGYDPGLDNFVPGYKMLNVAIMNNSFNIIEMSPQRDQWWIKTKNGDKKYRVIGDLRTEDAAAWNNLPDKARTLITYPLLLPIGARQVIDLFVPDKVPVEDFEQVIIYINSLDTTFEVLARQ